MGRTRSAVAVAVSLLAVACTTLRGDVTTFPPIVCSVEDVDGTVRSASVEIDGDPSTIEAGDLTFDVGYRSHPEGRVLETTVRRPNGEIVEQVVYVVPGRTSLRNQFGAERERLTGLHEVDPQGADRLLWSCTVGGIGMGFAMPDVFVAEGRIIFALFIGVCLAVSALPVVAKILIELRLMRRNVGQVIIVAGMVDDIVGWIMLSTLAGVASAGYFEVGRLGFTIAALVAFIGFAFTIGQRATDAVLRRSLRSSQDGVALPMTAVMLIVLVFAAITQAIEIEAVFGAFVAGIVISRSRYFRREVEETIHGFTHALSRTDRFEPEVEPSAVGQLARARSLAERFGRGAYPVLRVGSVASHEILTAADDRGTDLVVVGTQLRRHDDGRPFLGHGTEFLLEHAAQTVVAVVFPEDGTT